MKKTVYFAFGLYLSSQLELRSFRKSKDSETIDLNIILDDLSSNLQLSNSLPFYVSQVSDGIFIYVRNIACFLIQEKEIKIEPLSENQYLVESTLIRHALPAFLQMKGFVVLRGVAVMNQEKAHLMMGPAGIGKSSLAIALYQKGYTILSDSICIINPRNMFLVPDHVNLRLWIDSLEGLGIYRPNLLKVRAEIDKYYFPLSNTVINQSIEIKSISFFEINNKDRLSANKMNVIECFQKLLRYKVATSNCLNEEQKATEFKTLSKLSNVTNRQSIARLSRSFPVKELVNFVEHQIHSL